MAIENTTTPIPEELQGVSEEVARSIMAEYLPDQAGAPEPEKTPEDQGQGAVNDVKSETEQSVEIEPVKEDAANGAQDTGNDDPANTDSKDNPQKTVPYAALKEERDKRKAKDVELSERDKVIADLTARLEAVEKQAAQPVQVVQPAVQKQPETQPPVPDLVKDNSEVPYIDKLYVEAEKVFEKKYGYSPSSVNVSAKARAKFVEDHKREPDAFSDEDGDKLADYRLEIKHRDTVRLNALISDIDRGVQQYVTQQKQETERLQALNKDFVQEITTKENSQEILKFADERFKQQPVEMQKALSASLQRVQQGEGTYEDVSALRFFYESAELLYSQQQKESEASVAQGEPESKKEPGQPAAQVPDAAKKMEKKLEQAKSLPRSSQLNGGSANASTTVAELARKLEDGTITKEELEILKNGG